MVYVKDKAADVRPSAYFSGVKVPCGAEACGRCACGLGKAVCFI